MSIWESVKATASSFKDAAVAPYGAIWDLATTPFDEKDDSLGTVLNKMASRAGDVLDPILNTDTLTGFAFNETMQGLEYVYREGVSEPIATFNTMGGHVASNPLENWDSVFSGDKWGDAYAVAQERSIGQSSMLAQMNYLAPGLGATPDPLDQRTYDQVHENNEFLTSMGSGTIDFISRWYLDPGVVIGKGVQVSRAAKVHRKTTDKDFDVESGALIEKWDDPRIVHGLVGQRLNPFHREGIGGRLDEYIPFTDDLNGAQIFYATPELRRSNVGKPIAALLADANKIDDLAARHDVKRQVLRVALGDRSATLAARDEIRALRSPEIADALTNIAKGNTIDLKAHAAGEQILANPTLMAQLQGQLDNQKVVRSAVNQHLNRLQMLVNRGEDVADATPSGVAAGLKQVPGVHRKGKKALAREQGETLPRRLDAKTRELEDKATAAIGARLHKAPAVSTVVQTSLVKVPMKVVTVPWLRAPLGALDNLRTPHLQGMVNPHDWDSATSQLDSMMKTYGVPEGRRMELLSKAFMARTETEKISRVTEVQTETMKAVTAKYSAKQGRDITPAYVEKVMEANHAKVAAHLTAANGRMYAATTYGRNTAQMDEALQKAGREGEGWRVDELMVRDGQVVGLDDVDGVPISFPVLETQGKNLFPLMDFAAIKKYMDRDSGYFHRNAAAYDDLMEQEGRLRAQGAAGKNVDKALKKVHDAQDLMVYVGTKANRAWKMSVLLRLGYPLRVVADDHMRIWSQIGGFALYLGAAGELRRNAVFNHGGRRAGNSRKKQVVERRAQLRMERDRLESLLDDADLGRFDTRTAQLAGLDRKIVSAQTAGNERRADVLLAERETIADMAGESPRFMRAQLEDVKAELRRSTRAQKKDIRKKRIGEEDITLPGGYRADGAFAGPFGDSARAATGSNASWRNERWGYEAEEAIYKEMTSEGSYHLYTPLGEGGAHDEARHLVAWADAVNNQIGQSRVAQFFIKNKDATPEDFVRWLKQPEQKALRDRVPHFAHDAEDWGGRVYQLVHDYLPSDEMLDMVAKGKRVQAKRLQQMFADPRQRPNVHGATVMHNLGDSKFQGMVGRSINKLYKYLGELPSDTLARSPYFKAIYESELKTLHARNLTARKYRNEGHLVAEDIAELQSVARRNALGQLKRTLFDVSAHSNAAHFMRFISPFFAAHQESMMRWWNIIQDNPAVVRRIQQAFDMPGKLELVYDSETGEPVPSGTMPNSNHVVLAQIPRAWGGNEAHDPTHPNFKRSDWKISLNSFNLLLQSGSPTNPGTGPMAQVPVEWMVDQVAEQEDVEKLARLINPYAPNTTMDMLLPSTAKRVIALMRGEKSHETALMLSTNYRDLLIKFREDNGNREPTATEEAALWDRARHETRTEQWLRIGQNALAPYSGGPVSEFEVFRQGWRKINDIGELEGQDYDWRVNKFKEMYGDAYLPMIYSGFKNPANVDASNQTVAQIKQHKSLIGTVDERFAGAIVGRKGAVGPGAEPSRAAMKFLRNTPVATGSDTTFWSYSDPAEAMKDAAIRRGWDEYGRAMDQIQLYASQAGAESYRDIPALVEAKKQVIASLGERNQRWWEDYDTGSYGGYESGVLRDLKIIAQDRRLNSDETRLDIKYVQVYLRMRDMFTQALEARAAQGGASTMQAQSNADLARLYDKYIGKLEESSMDFADYWMPIIDQDPYLREAS